MNTARLSIVAAVGLAVAPLALAQDEAPEREERSASLTLEPYGSHSFETDLDGAGEYSVGRAGLDLTYDIPVWERSKVALGLKVERSEYDFSGATGLAAGGEPIGGATTYGVSAALTHPLDDEFAFIGGVGVEWAGEDGADFGESATLEGLAGVSWRSSDDLTLTLGVAVSDRLEDDVRVLPFVGVEWRFAENLRLSSIEAGRVLTGGTGGGIGLVYEAREDLRFVAGGGFSGREFRLDENGPIADGVLRDDRAIAGLGLVWEPSEAVSVELGAGAVVWSNIETLDSSGSTIGDEDGDPAPYITARVKILF